MADSAPVQWSVSVSACFTQMTASSSCFDSNTKTNQPIIISQQVIQSFQNNSKTLDDVQEYPDLNSNLQPNCCSKMVLTECRICQDEDEDDVQDYPYAHRKYIRKWCNKKGDITCEICNQVYSPDYAIPPAKFSPDVMTIDIRHA